ncbi:MAG: hypothetical protein F4227_01045 [Gammaproteobacteria bacterium]|nr:hypothetical protein [Gammaproteobacteria bacterium]MYF01596.1 hypothetical protein [Gammaproteobacteria bacterium]MYI76458.1 hypothetical protein [Gammaproteobacteria bacterium]
MSGLSKGRFRVLGLVGLGVFVGASISAFVTIAITNNLNHTKDVVLDAKNSEAENSTIQTSEVSGQVVDEKHPKKPQQDSFKSASGNDPDETLNILINDNVEDIAQLRTFLRVAEELVQQDGIRVLGRIFNSAMDSSVRDTIMKSVAQSAAMDDPPSVFHEATLLPREVQDIVLPEIVKTWAGSDPLIAFDAISNLDKSGLRVSLQETLIGAWAEHDAQDILAA